MIRFAWLGAATSAFVIGLYYADALTVTPEVVVFSARVGAASPPAQSIRVANKGAGAVTWQIKGQQRRWLSVAPKSGSAPESLTVAVDVAGLSAGMYIDTVYVSTSDASASPTPVPVLLRVSSRSQFGATSAAAVATYQVELSFTGYTGEFEGAPNCKVDLKGYDRLVGTVSGAETNTSDDDVVYHGFLRRDTAIDFCQTKGKKGPADDERVWCTVHLTGWAAASVELTVHSDSASGAYLKSDTVAAPAKRSVQGDCDPQETNQILSDYPKSDDGGGASPNGQPIDDAKAVDASGRRITFVSSGVPRLRVGTYPPTSPKGGWTLRVLKRLP